MIARNAAVLTGLLVLAIQPAAVAAQEPDGASAGEATSPAAAPTEAVLLLPAQAGAFVDACPVAELRINAGWWIDGIQVVCRDGRTLPWRGGTGGGQIVFTLAPGERIVAIGGLVGGNSGGHLYALQIHTTLRTSPLYGNGGAASGDPGRTPFRLDVPAGYTMVGVTGRATDKVNSIGLIVGGPQAGG